MTSVALLTEKPGGGALKMETESMIVSLLEIESLALGNKLAEAKLENCPDGKKRMIVAISREGIRYRTKCIEGGKASKALAIILNYIRWSRDVVTTERPTGVEKW